MGRAAIPLVIVLALAGAVLSGLLLLQHHGSAEAVSTVNALCGSGDAGCAVVAQSPYSQVAGVPLAAIGLAFYASLVFLLLLGLLSGPEGIRGACLLGGAALALALLVDLGLLALQAFKIHAYCRLCLGTYGINVVALLLLWTSAARPAPGFLRGEGRLALAGWGLATLSALLGILAANAVLSRGAPARAAALIGVPAGSPATELERAQQEARRLQETLDNPQKLQQYLDEKASRDFDQASVQPLDLKQVPVEGPATAPIHLVEYSDFLCPWCRQAAVAFHDFVPKAQGRVALHYKNFPLDQSCNPSVSTTVHAGACWMALGALCADEQGKFWAYHDSVFQVEDPAHPPKVVNPAEGDVVRIASAVGLDGGAFKQCLEAGSTKERLAGQIREGASAGVQATPTVFVNGKKLPRLQDLFQAIEKESRRAGLPPLPSAAR